MNRPLLLLAALATAWTGTDALAAALPDRLRLEYHLYYGKLRIGKTIRTLTSEGPVWRLKSRTRGSGLLKLTGEEIDEDGIFRLDGTRVFPIRFETAQRGRKKRRRCAVFDWPSETVRFCNGRQASLPANTQDSGTLFIALMLEPPADATPKELHLTDGKGVRRYIYQWEGGETLDTALGALNTVRLVRRRPGKDEAFTVWLAPDRSWLPVRISKRRGSKPIIRLELQSVEGL